MALINERAGAQRTSGGSANGPLTRDQRLLEDAFTVPPALPPAPPVSLEQAVLEAEGRQIRGAACQSSAAPHIVTARVARDAFKLAARAGDLLLASFVRDGVPARDTVEALAREAGGLARSAQLGLEICAAHDERSHELQLYIDLHRNDRKKRSWFTRMSRARVSSASWALHDETEREELARIHTTTAQDYARELPKILATAPDDMVETLARFADSHRAYMSSASLYAHGELSDDG